MADQFISVREAAQTLGVAEKKIMDFVENNQLQAYRIAGQFLRLKKSEVIKLQVSDNIVDDTTQFKYTAVERTQDFFYYNDFYIFAAFIIASLLAIIFYV